jgi:hypothetical protein
MLQSALVLTLAAALQSSSADLAPGEGREIVLSACTGCHTAELIVASHMSRKSWETTLTWMEETQGLAPLEPAVRKAILDYLERTQGLFDAEENEDASPWASPRYRPNPIW